MYDASRVMYVVASNQIHRSRPACKVHMRKQRYVRYHAMRGVHSAYVTFFAVSYSERCNLISVLKFLGGYMSDVHGCHDPFSLFQRRRGWHVRLEFLYTKALTIMCPLFSNVDGNELTLLFNLGARLE